MSTRALTSGPISPRPRSLRRGLAAFGALGAALVASPAALAQGAPPPTYQAQPPPGYYGQPQPAPYYGQPASTTGYYAPPGSYGTVGVGPKYLDWEEGDPIQPGYHPTTRIRRGLVIGGAVTFGTTYLLSAFSAAILVEGSNTTNNNGSMYGPLFVPVLGPFITIGTAHASGGGTFVLVLDGLSQTGGLAMFIAGLVAPKTALVRNDMAKAKIAPVPMSFGPSSAGLGAVGTF
ncbi:MAG: hypothetical protein U0359_31135 [Byssovorax sp.]